MMTTAQAEQPADVLVATALWAVWLLSAVGTAHRAVATVVECFLACSAEASASYCLR